MLKIALCDDEKVYINKVKSYLTKILSDSEFKISDFSSGNDLLKDYSISCFDIIFLDIEMTGFNGIETAKEIRNIDENVTIAFLTSHDDFAIQGYSVKAERFILKQQPENMYLEQLHSIINEYNQRNKLFQYINQNKTFNARLCDIQYFEVFNRTIVVHTNNSEFTYYGKISDLEEQYYKDGFIKPNKSYLVNLTYIKFIEKNDIIMKNGIIIGIGRSVKDKIIKEYLNYMSGK